MTAPRAKPFGPDAIATCLLAMRWVLLPAITFGVVLVAPPARDPGEIGGSKDGFLLLLVPFGLLFLMLFGWICLRVMAGRRVGLIAAAVVRILGIAGTLLRGGPHPEFWLIPDFALAIFVVARFRDWGPRPL